METTAGYASYSDSLESGSNASMLSRVLMYLALCYLLLGARREVTQVLPRCLYGSVYEVRDICKMIATWQPIVVKANLKCISHIKIVHHQLKEKFSPCFYAPCSISSQPHLEVSHSFRRHRRSLPASRSWTSRQRYR